jgi:hypothetical protein
LWRSLHQWRQVILESAGQLASGQYASSQYASRGSRATEWGSARFRAAERCASRLSSAEWPTGGFCAAEQSAGRCGAAHAPARELSAADCSRGQSTSSVRRGKRLPLVQRGGHAWQPVLHGLQGQGRRGNRGRYRFGPRRRSPRDACCRRLLGPAQSALGLGVGNVKRTARVDARKCHCWNSQAHETESWPWFKVKGGASGGSMPGCAVVRHRRSRNSSARETSSLASFNYGCHSVPMRDNGRLGLRARARWGPNFFLFRKSHPINILRRKVGRPFAANEIASQLGRAAQLSMARHPTGLGFVPGQRPSSDIHRLTRQ